VARAGTSIAVDHQQRFDDRARGLILRARDVELFGVLRELEP